MTQGGCWEKQHPSKTVNMEVCRRWVGSVSFNSNSHVQISAYDVLLFKGCGRIFVK